MLIGRQVLTSFNKIIDLLAIDGTGSLIVIELKRDKTPREVIAQTLDYASWVKGLDGAATSEMYRKFVDRFQLKTGTLDKVFHEKSLGYPLDEENLNSSHQMVIVASELDSSTERIVNYLNEYNIPINVFFFKVFRDGETRYLSRAWFIDPVETQEHATAPKNSVPWNGEFYVSFGDGESRSWEDACRYGFICGGGKPWYSRTLFQLQTGDRVWVNIPKTGYVGVGVVETPAVKVDLFKVATERGEIPLLEAPINAGYHKEYVDDEDRAEYLVWRQLALQGFKK